MGIRILIVGIAFVFSISPGFGGLTLVEEENLNSSNKKLYLSSEKSEKSGRTHGCEHKEFLQKLDKYVYARIEKYRAEDEVKDEGKDKGTWKLSPLFEGDLLIGSKKRSEWKKEVSSKKLKIDKEMYDVATLPAELVQLENVLKISDQRTRQEARISELQNLKNDQPGNPNFDIELKNSLRKLFQLSMAYHDAIFKVIERSDVTLSEDISHLGIGAHKYAELLEYLVPRSFFVDQKAGESSIGYLPYLNQCRESIKKMFKDQGGDSSQADLKQVEEVERVLNAINNQGESLSVQKQMSSRAQKPHTEEGNGGVTRGSVQKTAGSVKAR